MLHQGMSFDWRQQGVESLLNKKPAELAKQYKDAYNHESTDMLVDTYHDPDKGKMLNVLQAANQQGGGAEMNRVIQQSGIDPKTAMEALKGNPAQQHLLYDLMQSAGEGERIQNTPLSFKP
jgi:hypothetical protein